MKALFFFCLVLLVHFYYQSYLHRPKGLPCLSQDWLSFLVAPLLGLCLPFPHMDLIDLSKLNKSFLAQKAASV